jgi:hypothetical protein
MSKPGSKAVKHTCKDGEVRHIEPVYFREVDPQTGKRRFLRRDWFCGHCGYGSRVPV